MQDVISAGFWSTLWSWLDAAVPVIIAWGLRTHIVQSAHSEKIKTLQKQQDLLSSREDRFARREDVTRVESKIDRVLEILAARGQTH